MLPPPPFQFQPLPLLPSVPQSAAPVPIVPVLPVSLAVPAPGGTPWDEQAIAVTEVIMKTQPAQDIFQYLYKCTLQELIDSTKKKPAGNAVLLPASSLITDDELLSILREQQQQHRQLANNTRHVNPQLVEIMRETQKSLIKFVKRPSLHLFYLQRPPFMFIHDIITDVIRSHGFLSGLFSMDEANRFSASRSSKSRIHFFRKLVGALKSTTGEPFPTAQLTHKQWSKLTKGALPFYSNWILQTIGFALEKKMNSDLAVLQINTKFNNNADKSPFPYCYSWDTPSSANSVNSTSTIAIPTLKRNQAQLAADDVQAPDLDYSVSDYMGENPRKYNKARSPRVNPPLMQFISEEDEDYESGSSDVSDDEEDDKAGEEDLLDLDYAEHQHTPGTPIFHKVSASDRDMSYPAEEEPMDFS